MKIVEQAPTYLDRTSSIEQLVNTVGPVIEMEVDEVGDLFQTLQEHLVSFLFVAAPTCPNQQATIQQALDDCAQARAIQARLALFISSLQAHDPSEQTMEEKLLKRENGEANRC